MVDIKEELKKFQKIVNIETAEEKACSLIKETAESGDLD